MFLFDVFQKLLMRGQQMTGGLSLFDLFLSVTKVRSFSLHKKTILRKRLHNRTFSPVTAFTQGQNHAVHPVLLVFQGCFPLPAYALWCDVSDKEEPVCLTLGYESEHKQDRAKKTKHVVFDGSKYRTLSILL